ncbi:MAG: HAD-IC family P-type ATPase [Firmicutes bacterium]|nr:HAD-IC family P-type ATPase [Bacillota bacterium]
MTTGTKTKKPAIKKPKLQEKAEGVFVEDKNTVEEGEKALLKDIMTVKNGDKKEQPKKARKIGQLSKAKRFEVNHAVGLSTEQVKERYLGGFYNASKTRTTKSYFEIFFGNMFTFFNFIAAVVAAIFIYLGTYAPLIGFLPIYMANLLIQIIQDIRAKLAVEKISLLTAPTATVIRNGKEEEIAVSDVVLDDIMVIGLGRQVVADCIIRSGMVEVNESLLTGESVPVKKKEGDLLYAGSFIVSGKVVAQVERIGDYNYSSSLVKKAQSKSKPKSDLLRNINRVIKAIGVLVIPLATIIFIVNYSGNQIDTNLGLDVLGTALFRSANAAILMVPAGMYLAISAALSVGVITLFRKRTHIQDIYSIEMLSRVDVLCLDKTGTITDGTMVVNKVISVNDAPHHVNTIMGSMLTALQENNQTAIALAGHFGYNKELPVASTIPFSSARKFSAVSFKIGEKFETYVMGAPEFVLKTPNKVVDKAVKEFAEQGYRVLLLAGVKGKSTEEKLPAGVVTPISLIVIEDKIRESAARTLKWFYENDVDLKIISGDNPITVSEIGKRVGVKNADKFLSLEGLSKQQVVDAADKYTIFGRVSPEQKAILVKALKNKGKKVGMTGDGVNDILALKEADCSIAMASGSEAARNVSHVVLLDSDFASMPSVVAEGRRVINNISKASSLFLMNAIFVILLNVITLIPIPETWVEAGRIIPFYYTNRAMLVTLFINGIPALVLSLQPNNDRINTNFLMNMISKAVPGSIMYIFATLACFIFTEALGGDFATMATLSILFTGLFIVYRICKPFDLIRTILFIGVAVGITLALVVLPWDERWFDFAPFVGNQGWVNILGIVVIVQFSYAIYSTVVKYSDIGLAYLNKTRKKILDIE